MELLDAIASNSNARSPAELSLNPLFRCDYSALYKVIAHFFQASSVEQASQERFKQEKQLIEVIASVLPPPAARPFQLFGLDVTPIPRPYDQTLADRLFVYQPNPVKGNKPVSIGHPYSILSVLPEPAQPDDAPWSIPLSGQRVSITQSSTEVGSNQVSIVLSHPSLP